jgi:hypothetical protein
MKIWSVQTFFVIISTWISGEQQVDLESMGYQRWIKWLKEYLLGCWTQILLRYELSGRLKKINSRLNQISDNQKEYKIEHTPLATLTSSTTATSAWYGKDLLCHSCNYELSVSHFQRIYKELLFLIITSIPKYLRRLWFLLFKHWLMIFVDDI